MDITDLATIESIPLREVWPAEASDFTPWLAANIGELGQAIGVDIEVTRTEAAIGPSPWTSSERYPTPTAS